MDSFTIEERDHLTKELDKIESKLKEELNQIECMKADIDLDDKIHFDNILFQHIISSEYNFLNKRKLYAEVENEKNKTISHSKLDYPTNVFNFEKKDNYYHFTLPELVKKAETEPSKMEKMRDKFIFETMQNMLKSYFNGLENKNIFTNFTIIFIHHIDKNCLNFTKDTDNLSLKKPIDAINGILIRNDTAPESHICQFAVWDDTAYTDMYIVEDHPLYEAIKGILGA